MNKFQLSVNELTLLLKEQTQSEKINDLITLTQSLLKRVDKLEKENTNLKEEVKELKEKLNDLVIIKDLHWHYVEEETV